MSSSSEPKGNHAVVLEMARRMGLPVGWRVEGGTEEEGTFFLLKDPAGDVVDHVCSFHLEWMEGATSASTLWEIARRFRTTAEAISAGDRWSSDTASVERLWNCHVQKTDYCPVCKQIRPSWWECKRCRKRFCEECRPFVSVQIRHGLSRLLGSLKHAPEPPSAPVCVECWEEYGTGEVVPVKSLLDYVRLDRNPGERRGPSMPRRIRVPMAVRADEPKDTPREDDGDLRTD